MALQIAGLSQQSIQMRVDRGLQRAADILGAPHSLFRPLSSMDPVSGSPHTTLFCAFDSHPNLKLLANLRSEQVFVTLLANPALVQIGDYIVGPETYFVARVEPLKAAACVLCGQTLDVISSDVATDAGTNGYGGRTAATDTVVATGWPASMVARSRGSSDITKLPSDTRAAYYEVLLPPIPDVELSFGMRLRDSDGQEYFIVSAEYSHFGWKILAGLSTT